MLTRTSATFHPHSLRFVRRALEYGVAVSVALLCSYWILQGRW